MTGARLHVRLSYFVFRSRGLSSRGTARWEKRHSGISAEHAEAKG